MLRSRSGSRSGSHAAATAASAAAAARVYQQRLPSAAEIAKMNEQREGLDTLRRIIKDLHSVPKSKRDGHSGDLLPLAYEYLGGHIKCCYPHCNSDDLAHLQEHHKKRNK